MTAASGADQPTIRDQIIGALRPVLLTRVAEDRADALLPVIEADRERAKAEAVSRVLALVDRHDRSARHRRRLADRWMEAERYQLADAFRRLAHQSSVEAARIRAAVAEPAPPDGGDVR